MADTFQYCVAMVQGDRATFLNRQWLGSKPIDTANSTESLESCPWVWDWLGAMGSDGWELVGTMPTNAEHSAVTLYLKRRV